VASSRGGHTISVTREPTRPLTGWRETPEVDPTASPLTPSSSMAAPCSTIEGFHHVGSLNQCSRATRRRRELGQLWWGNAHGLLPLMIHRSEPRNAPVVGFRTDMTR